MSEAFARYLSGSAGAAADYYGLFAEYAARYGDYFSRDAEWS
jgi:hypothetical protein